MFDVFGDTEDYADFCAQLSRVLAAEEKNGARMGDWWVDPREVLFRTRDICIFR